MSKTYLILVGEKFQVTANSPEEAMKKLEATNWGNGEDVTFIEADSWIDESIPAGFDVVPTNQTSN